MSTIDSDNNAPHAYLTPHAETSIHDSQVRFLITNGELNATTADQHGLPATGLSHGWKWDHDGALIDDLQKITWRGRSVWLAPDSNAWTSGPLLRQIYALGVALEREGAVIAIPHLPPTGKSTTTLHQFLTQHGADAFTQLPQCTLTDPDFEDARHWEAHRRTMLQSNRPTTSPAYLSQVSDLRHTPPLSLPPFPPEAWTEPFAIWRELLSPHTDAPDVFRWAILATGWGLILGRRVYYGDTAPIYPNLWTLLLGPTALARKSTMLLILRQLLTSLGTKYTSISGLNSAEGLAEQMHQNPDFTTLITEDEFRRFLGVGNRKVTANLIPTLQSLFDCNVPFEVIRKETIRIPEPFVAFIAATPLAYIEEMLTEAHFSGGFLNRFLFLPGEPNDPIPRPTPLSPKPSAQSRPCSAPDSTASGTNIHA